MCVCSIPPVCAPSLQGIILVKHPDDIPPEEDVTAVRVVQCYIERPLLIGGHKFDLRLYCLISSVHPTLRVFLHREGLARCERVWGGGSREGRCCSDL
jgi:hypothetical protein